MSIPSRGKPEDRARTNIDRLLDDAGWSIQNRDSVNIVAGRGIAIGEFQLAPGYGLAQSLARNQPHALIHMTMGSGKTFHGRGENAARYAGGDQRHRDSR